MCRSRATLIALMINDEPAVGVVSAPALGRRWWASLGGGAYAGKSLMSATAIHVSERGQHRGCLAELCLDLCLGRVTARASSSSTCYGAAGGPARTGTSGRTCCSPRVRVDIACEPELALHDMAACSVIVTEAGGRFTDLDGHPGPLGTGGCRHQRSGCTMPSWQLALEVDDDS